MEGGAELTQEDLINTKVLFDRPFQELLELLDRLWIAILEALESPAAVAKVSQLFRVSELRVSSMEISGSTSASVSAWRLVYSRRLIVRRAELTSSRPHRARPSPCCEESRECLSQSLTFRGHRRS